MANEFSESINTGQTGVPDSKRRLHISGDHREQRTLRSMQSLRASEHRISSAKNGIKMVAAVLAGLFIVTIASLVPNVLNAVQQSRPKADAAMATTITTATVRFENFQQWIKADGAVEAWESIAISPEVNELKIESILVHEGEHVTRGQVLARMNDAVVSAELNEARARLAASKANLQKSIMPNREEEVSALRAAAAHAKSLIAEAKANVESVRTRYLNSQVNAGRYVLLQRQGAVSEMDARNIVTEATALRGELTRAERQVEAACQSSNEANEHLRLATNGGRKEDVLMARAEAAENQARVDRLEALLAQTIIRAPEDGLIVKCDARRGEMATVGKSLFTLVRNNRLELKVKLPETQVLAVRPGQFVKISAKPDSSPAIYGKVRRISPSIDDGSRLAAVYIDFDHCDYIRPGMFFYAQIEAANNRALSLPREAVLDAHGHPYVYALQGNRVKKTEITAGDTYGDQVEIKDGLIEGQQVALSGAAFLRDSDLVNMVQQ